MRSKVLAGITLGSLIIGCLLSTPGQAASSSQPSIKSLVASPVGFRDVSYCSGYINGICDKTFKGDMSFRTTWAFSVTNSDSRKSALHVRAQLTFEDASGNTIYQTVASIPGEIKPGKIGWAAPIDDGGNGAITGVTRITAKVVAATWVNPTKATIQAPVILELEPNGFAFAMCPLGSVCQSSGSDTMFNSFKLNGIMSWRGPAGTATGTVIYFDSQGMPIGGTTSRYTRNSNFKTGSNTVQINFMYLPPKVLSEIAIFKIYFA